MIALRCSSRRAKHFLDRSQAPRSALPNVARTSAPVTGFGKLSLLTPASRQSKCIRMPLIGRIDTRCLARAEPFRAHGLVEPVSTVGFYVTLGRHRSRCATSASNRMIGHRAGSTCGDRMAKGAKPRLVEFVPGDMELAPSGI